MNLSDIASKPLSPGKLREFFDHVVDKKWPIHSNKNIPKYIILQSYCSLWSGDVDIMTKYFFKNAHDLQELKELLKKNGLFGPTYGPRSQREQQPEPEYQRGKQCGHLFKKGETVYRCKNCAVDDTCVLCSKCFHSSNHQGHHVKIWISRGGACCDCGDPEAWKIPLNCSIHTEATSQQPIEPLPANVIQSVRDTIRVVLDYILETFAAVQENTAKIGTVESIKKRCQTAHKALGLPVDDPDQEYRCVLWNDETHSFNTVIKVLKAALNTDTDSAQKLAEIVDEFGRHTLTHDTDLQALVARFSPFETVKLEVSITTTQMDSREYISFYLLSWLKDLTKCQFFSNVQDVILDTMCQVLSEDWELSPELARISTLDRRERQQMDHVYEFEEEEEDVEAEDEEEEQVDVEMLDADLGEFFDDGQDDGVSEDDSLQTANEVFGDETDELASIIQVITNEDRQLNEPIQREEEEPDKKDILDMEDRLEKWIDYSNTLKAKERKFAQQIGLCTSDVSDTNSHLRDEFYRKTRLDYLLQFDVRLWKSVRNYIKDILFSCFITHAKYRPVLGVRYSRNYPELVDALLFKDREPDLSISDLSVQIMTVPTVSSLLVSEFDFFGMVTTILKNFYPTNQITLDLAQEASHVQIDCLSKAARRQSILHVVSNLKHLMSTDTVKVQVSKNPEYLGYFLDFMYQFQEMDPTRRQENTHVEFESRAWITAFGLTLQLVKLCNLFADAYQGSTMDDSRDLWRSVFRVLKEISTWKQILEPREQQADSMINSLEKQEFKQVGNTRIVKYDITQEAISFHHPFHWLLSKLLQKVPLLDIKLEQDGGSVGEMIHDALSEIPYDYEIQKNAFLLVIEPPIRTIASIAQINCGVWVRNGFGVRNQALSYKESQIRENTLDSDIYLVQVALAICDSDTVLLTLMDRFQLLDWFQGKTTHHPCYDTTQYAYMIEEFLNLLVICATEHSLLSGLSKEDRVRQFIIQYLGLSNMSYSELVKVIPHSLSDHASFEEQLNQVANYKAPEGLTDKGIYELKPEYLDTVNPYFWHYTRNQQEEAHQILKKRIGQESTLRYIQSGPFKELGKFLHSRVFCQILAYSLLNHTNDTILDLALYLAVQAVYDPRTYDSDLVQFMETEKIEDDTVIEIMLKCLEDQNPHELLELIVTRVKDKASEPVQFKIQEWQNKKSAPITTQVDDSEQEKKKAAAKARQAAIMSQFADAQSKFMQQHADIYDSEQDEDMEEPQPIHQEDNGIEVVRKCQFTADTCIVCQEDFDETKLYGMLGCIQVSNTHRLAPLNNPHVFADVLKVSASQHPWGDNDDEDKEPFIGFPQDSHLTGLDISSCGHLMHASCFDTFRRSNSNDMLDRLNVILPSASSTHTRFLCPLCKALGNVLVPIVWTGKKETFPGVMAPTTPYSTMCDSIRDVAMDLKKSFEFNIDDQTLFVSNDSYLVIRDKETLTHFYNQLMRETHNSLDQPVAPMNLPNSLNNLYTMYATTIGDLEIAQRGSSRADLLVEHTGTFIDSVPRSSQILLKILSLTNTLIPNFMNTGWQAEDRFTKERLALQSINQFMPDTVTHLIEDMVEADNLKPLLMEDSFHALVRFSFVVHEMPTIDIHHLLRAMYVAELAKIIIALASHISASIFKPEHPMKKDTIRQLINTLNQTSRQDNGAGGIRGFANDVLINLKFSQNVIEYIFSTVQPGAFVALVRTFVLPFIRKSFLFMVLHHGYIPQQSTVDNTTTNELDHLLAALNLPLFDTVFDEIQQHERDLLTNWCHHYLESNDTISIHLPTKYKMVTLPYCMDDLLDESVNRKCTKCNTVPEHSAICLICGTFVCARHFCCMEDDKGECNVHMKRCGGEIGIYIMIKECFLLLLHANGGHIMNAPYLDNHGEADIFFKRGARQYLNEKRYEQIRELWLNQSIPSFVRRKMESHHSSALWESF